MTRQLTTEQQAQLDSQKSKLIDQTLDSQTDKSVSRDDVAYLVDRYIALRLSGTGHGEAMRVTYGCLYQQSDIRFNPHARIAEMRSDK